VALSPEYTRTVGELAHRNGLALHLDGARLFNAAVSLGVPAHELTDAVDSVTICLSKGLCAPVGSVLCGSRDFIYRAHRIRKQLGGGLRQAGILAAAGILALETMVDRLAEDHARARRLASYLADIPGLFLEPGSPHTNMIFLGLADEVPLNTLQVTERLEQLGVKVGAVASRRFRLVTHYWIDDLGVERAVEAFNQVLCPVM
jgi:threonine aldolase